MIPSNYPKKKREELYDVITKEAVAWAVGYASPERIDEINILQATYEAMREAIGKLSPAPDLLLMMRLHSRSEYPAGTDH